MCDCITLHSACVRTGQHQYWRAQWLQISHLI